MIRRIFILTLVFTTTLLSWSLEEAKKLHFAEQTKENVKKYKETLEHLAAQNRVQAILMLGDAYNSGSHWDIDKKKAERYYLKAAQLKSKKAAIKLGVMYYNQEDFIKAKKYLLLALNNKQYFAAKYLLDIAILEKNKDSVNRYVEIVRQHGLPIDELSQENIKKLNKSNSKVMEYIESKTFEASKAYVLSLLKTVSSIKTAFNYLGYEVDEYLIHTGTDPNVEIILKRIKNPNINEEMAMYIAGDNILKTSLLKSLIWANHLEPFLQKEIGYELKGVEIEVGTDASAKLVIKKVKQ